MRASSATSNRLLLLVLWGSILTLIGGYWLFERESVFGGLSGVVLDEETGKPIEGAVVFVHWQLERVRFEISRGPTVYWSETTTDKDGRFKFNDSVPVPVKLSLQLRMLESDPTIGVSKDGYGFYLKAIGHNKSWLFQRKYAPKRKQIEIELVKRTVNEILTDYGVTLEFMMELEALVSPFHCDPARMEKTIAQLEMLLKKAANYKNNRGFYYEIDNFVKSRKCGT